MKKGKAGSTGRPDFYRNQLAIDNFLEFVVRVNIEEKRQQKQQSIVSRTRANGAFFFND